MNKKIAVSSCFINNVRYDGENSSNESINNFIEIAKRNDIQLVFVCPEIFGELPVPRDKSERKGEKVFTYKGVDVTNNFVNGANKVLDIIKEENIDIAILKSKSPSCGLGKIYDGNFNGTLISGNGIAVDLLLKNNVKVYSSCDLNDLSFIEKHFNIKLK